MSSNWTETTVPTPSTHAATIDQTMTALRQETTSPSAEGRFPQQGRRTRDMEATSDAQQEDLTSDPEDEAIAASHSSAVQEASSSITATSPPLSSERIAYLLSDDAFSDHYALAGSEWGWGYGPAEAESSGSEAEANSGAAPSLDASSGTSASSASSSTQNPPQGNPSHACTICHKQFTRPSTLAAHMNTHREAMPHVCGVPGCTETFESQSSATRHRYLHGMTFARRRGG